MISAFRTGEVAGSAAAHDSNISIPSQPRQVAQAALAERKRFGIAHCYPEEEFIQGFLVGYNGRQNLNDGLQMAVLVARKQGE